MAGTHNLYNQPNSIAFSFYTPDEVRRLSVKKINNLIVFDNLGRPNPGGLYDPALGPTRQSANCITCGQRYDFCPGHLGHIDLVVPVYNPLLFPDLFKLLRMGCHECKHFLLSPTRCLHYARQFRLIDAGLIADAKNYLLCVQAAKERSLEQVIAEKLSPEAQEVLARKTIPIQIPAQSKHGRMMRRMLIAQFLEDSNKVKQCQSCSGHRLRLRSDRAGKIFRKLSNSQQVTGLTLSVDVFDDSSSSEEEDTTLGTYLRSLGDVDADELEDAAEVAAVLKDLGELDDDNNNDDDDDGKKASAAKKKNKKEKEARRAKREEARRLAREKAKRELAEQQQNRERSSITVEEQLVTPIEAREIIRGLWKNELELCRYLFCSISLHEGYAVRMSSPDMFFVDTLAVPANRFRPPVAMGDMVFEHPFNGMYQKILASNAALVRAFQKADLPVPQDSDAVAKPRDSMSRAMPAWVALQDALNVLVDSQKSSSLAEKRDLSGIKQLLEKKEGMFRRLMMGKRVNYAARSVISPDPYIGTDEIGVPEIFARTLTFPEPVNPHNVAELRQLVINGPDMHPGANYVENEFGRRIDLSRMKKSQRIGIAKVLDTCKPHSDALGCIGTKKVFRHLRTGDYVIMNRQPTLHKPGMMAHRVRVMKKEKTLRMHYANCNTYNADFDGDEMNMHFPQDELARTDAEVVMSNNQQYIVPTSGKPLRGLIQDHIVSSVNMTIKNKFFKPREVMQLLYPSLNRVVPPGHEFKLDPPAILAPVVLYTGKQVISMIIKNLALSDESTRGLYLNLSSTTKTPPEAWTGLESTSMVIIPETKVIVRHSELLVGVVDKNQIGASSYGIVHAAFELFGAEYAGKLLTAFGRLFTLFLQTLQGFTCGLEDIVLTPEAEAQRKSILKQSQTSGSESAARYLNLPPSSSRQELMEGLRQKLNTPDDSALLDQISKAPVHDITSQVQKIALPLGQFRRFPNNNLSMMTMTGAKGSNVNFSQISCLLGQQELEGKRVPRTIAGRTAPAFEPYDPAAKAGGYIVGRFLSGIGPQEYYFHCMAGREGLVDTAVKTSRSGYLQRCLIKYMEGLKVHYDHTVRDADGAIVQFNYGEDSLDVVKTGYLGKLDFFLENFESFWQLYKPIIDRTRSSKQGPILKTDLVSQGFEKRIDDLIKKNAHKLTKSKNIEMREGRKLIPEEKLRDLLRVKFMNCLVHAGESVGVLAGQSIGEPSTQMTLNTFHLAGHGAVNVTMGIPRLREIVMTASKAIKSPIMFLPMLSSVTSEQAAVVASRMSRVTLFDCLDGIQVAESLRRKEPNSPLLRVYTITLTVADLTEHPLTAKLPLSLLHNCLQHNFPVACDRTISITLARKTGKIYLQGAATNKPRKASGDDDEGDGPSGGIDDDEGGDDAAQELPPDGLDSDNDNDDDDGDVQPEGEGEGEGAKMENRKRTQTAKYDEGDNDANDREGSDVGEEEMPDAPRDVLRARTVAAEESDDDSPIHTGTRYVTTVKLDRKTSRCEVEVAISASSRRLQMVEIVEKVAKICVVQSLPGITRAITEKTKSGVIQVQTEGVNFLVIAERFSDVVDVNKIKSNDIGAILNYYGIEAARNAVVQEVSGVFAVYGISVDLRHLNLIGDTMTYSGDFLGFNRNALKNNLSPLLKMSFESCVTFLSEAAARGEVDTLSSPASSIVMGQVVKYGSGLCRLMHPLVFEKPSA